MSQARPPLHGLPVLEKGKVSGGAGAPGLGLGPGRSVWRLRPVGFRVEAEASQVRVEAASGGAGRCRGAAPRSCSSLKEQQPQKVPACSNSGRSYSCSSLHDDVPHLVD